MRLPGTTPCGSLMKAASAAASQVMPLRFMAGE
jgi:hypothetical protein